MASPVSPIASRAPPRAPAPTGAPLALAGAALLWSGNFIAGRALRADFSPAALNLMRWTLCLALFAPWVARKAWRCRSALAREWRLLCALGATGIAGFHTLVYLALETATAIDALLMLSLAPAAILVGAAATGASRPSRVQWAGTAIALAGAAIVLTRGSVATLLAFKPAVGDLWMVVAVVLWAAYSLLLRRRPPDLPPDVALAASIVPALALLAPAVAWRGFGGPLAFTPGTLAMLAYIALFASLAAFLLWSYGVDRVGPERAGPYVQLMPVFGAALAVLLLGETIAIGQVVGAAFVLAGIALVQRGSASLRSR